jgi:hypothetical protein
MIYTVKKNIHFRIFFIANPIAYPSSPLPGNYTGRITFRLQHSCHRGPGGDRTYLIVNLQFKNREVSTPSVKDIQS